MWKISNNVDLTFVAGDTDNIGLFCDVSRVRDCRSRLENRPLRPALPNLRQNYGHSVIAFYDATFADGMCLGTVTLGNLDRYADVDDWRKRHPDFQEPRLSHNIQLASLLRTIGKRQGFAPAEVAVAWVLHNRSVTEAIVGARRPSQVRGVDGAADLRLTPRDLAEIEVFLAREEAMTA